MIELVLTALVADGHVLLEDVSGTGKTMLAKALARSVNVPFSMYFRFYVHVTGGAGTVSSETGNG